MPAQLVSLIEAESLVNDGTAVVLFSLALATGTGEPASAPGVFVDHLRPKCWCQQRGALSQTGSGRRSSIRDPYLGKVVLYLAFALGAFRLYRTCATDEPTLVTRRAHSTHVTELASQRRRAVLGREAAQTWAVRRDHRRPP
jgi:hypothetical protein